MESAIIFTPKGRDAEVAAGLLAQSGIASETCLTLTELADRVSENSLFAVVTEESLRTADAAILKEKIESQPSWSDFQFIILTSRDGQRDRSPLALLLSNLLRNVSFLERPFHPTSFVSLARTALQGRQRQFEARARIAELRESELRLRTALSAGQLGSWQLDLVDWTLTTSPACRAVFGYSADEEFSYENLRSCIHPEDRDRMAAEVAQTIETGKDYSIEYRTIWRDGSQHWAAINARLLKRPDGSSQMVGVSADITARKNSEVELLTLNEGLEQRVAERTNALEAAHALALAESQQRERAEVQLRQIQKTEMIGQLTGGVAHDFNNLLMAVLGNLELLAKRIPDDPKLARLVEGATLGAQRGAALTQRLLAFARKQDLSPQPSDMVDVVKNMNDLIEKSVGQSIERRLEFSDNLPKAMVDVNQVELALLNLVVNARDAMPNGGMITIRVDQATSTGAGDLEPGEYIRLSVIDTGSGMSEEVLKKATEPFFSTKEVGKGTGLGLSMVHGLASQLKGALRIASEIGVGTNAVLWLPATQASAQEVVAAVIEDVSDARSLTILAVDDDALISMSTIDMLEDLGHQVIEAFSGEQALEFLGTGCPVDLMITDFSMPKMNGAELSRAALEIRPGLPILIASGYADLPEGTHLNLPRLAKPYGQRELAAEINKLMGV